jgi:serine/threonine protein kinase
MAGGQCYGKAVDIWAVGFIMYELIGQKHPLWEKGDDNKSYKQKAVNFKQLKFSRKFNKL